MGKSVLLGPGRLECYASRVERNAAQRWFAGQVAAGRRSLELMKDEGAPSPQESFAQAMELCDLVTVEPADELRIREEKAARNAWAKVRAWVARHAPQR